MKTIKERYKELEDELDHMTDIEVKEILDTINMEYFDNTLDLEIIEDEMFGFFLKINGTIYYDDVWSMKEDLQKLQDLHETYTLKRKINKINETY